MSEFTTKSGSAIFVGPAPWGDAKKLKSAIVKEAAASGIKFDSIQADVSSLIAAVLNIESSEAVDAALWACLARCTRDGNKITPSTFDEAEARADYYEIVIACVSENLRPLAQGLLSVFPPALLAALQRKTENAPLNSQSTTSQPSSP